MPSPTLFMVRADIFRDRAEAGRKLAERLRRYRSEHPVVLGIPRGGVAVAFEIARRLDAPLDIVVVRKVGDPANPEYGLGAVAEGGVQWLDEPRVREAGYTVADLAPTIARELAEVDRRVRTYRGDRPRIDLRGRTVIVADDGVATGGTVLAGVESVRRLHPSRLVVALGVCPYSAYRRLKSSADELLVLLTPEYFHAVGEWFQEFPSVEDVEVRRLLAGREIPLRAVPA